MSRKRKKEIVIVHDQDVSERGIYLADISFIEEKKGKEERVLGKKKDQVYTTRNPKFLRHAKSLRVVSPSASELSASVTKILVEIKKLTGFTTY